MQSWLLWKRKHLHRLVKMIEQLLQWHFNFWVKRVIAISITNIYLASVLYTVTNLDQGRAAMGRRKERNVELCRYFCSCCLVSPFFWLRFAVSSLAERFLHVRWPIMTNCKRQAHWTNKLLCKSSSSPFSPTYCTTTTTTLFVPYIDLQLIQKNS